MAECLGFPISASIHQQRAPTIAIRSWRHGGHHHGEAGWSRSIIPSSFISHETNRNYVQQNPLWTPSPLSHKAPQTHRSPEDLRRLCGWLMEVRGDQWWMVLGPDNPSASFLLGCGSQISCRLGVFGMAQPPDGAPSRDPPEPPMNLDELTQKRAQTAPPRHPLRALGHPQCRWLLLGPPSAIDLHDLGPWSDPFVVATGTHSNSFQATQLVITIRRRELMINQADLGDPVCGALFWTHGFEPCNFKKHNYPPAIAGKWSSSTGQ